MKTAAIIAILALLLPVNAGAQEWSKGSETTETLGQMLSATNTGIGKLGEIGEGLKDVASGQFVGARRARNALATSWNNSFEDWRRSSEGSKGSAGFRLVSKALWWNDFADGVVAPLVEGDGRGTVSGAVNIAINDTVVAAGTAAFAAAGAAIGSVIPIAGTAAGATVGATVGGAIGTVAGGFISSIAFDRFGKAFVAKGVEGVIASLIDVSPLQQAINSRAEFLAEKRAYLQQAMDARDEYLRAQADPELRKAWNDLDAVSESFGSEGNVELIGPGPSYYAVAKKPEAPLAATPEAASEDVLIGVKNFEMLTWNPARPDVKGKSICNINGQKFICRSQDRSVCCNYSSANTGAINGNRLEGTVTSKVDTRPSPENTCNASWVGTAGITFNLTADGKVSGEVGTGYWHYTSMTGDCAGRDSKPWTAQGGPFEGSWRKLP